MNTASVSTTSTSSWQVALRWGFGVALIHRLFLTIWLATVWLTVGEPYGMVQALEITEAKGQANLPTMATPVERALLGIWRRWDGTHYFNLAQNGYRLSDPGPTVFGPLTPIAIRAGNILLPGPAEFAAIVFITLMFGFMLTFLYRFVSLHFDDELLAKHSVIVMAILPLSYFFAAAMSEAAYMAMVLGFFYFGYQRNWLLAAVCGALATLARAQGVLLLGIAGLMLLEQAWPLIPDWRNRFRRLILAALPLLLIPLAYAGFQFYRSGQGLPPLETVFYEQSFVELVDPLTGFVSNLRQIALNPLNALQNVDYVALLLAIGLIGVLLYRKRFRRWPLIVYCVGYLLVFVSKLNYPWGSYTELLGTQSMARYTLALFPLIILLADLIWRWPKYARMMTIAASIGGLLVFSAQFALGGGPA